MINLTLIYTGGASGLMVYANATTKNQLVQKYLGHCWSKNIGYKVYGKLLMHFKIVCTKIVEIKPMSNSVCTMYLFNIVL